MTAHYPDDPALYEALNVCLDAINAGESLDSVLARYPQYVDRLRMLLEAGELVRLVAPAPAEVYEAYRRGRARLVAALDDAGGTPLMPVTSPMDPPSEETSPPAIRAVPRPRSTLRSLLAAAAVLILIGGVALVLADRRQRDQFAIERTGTAAAELTPTLSITTLMPAASPTPAVTTTTIPSPSATPTATLTSSPSATSTATVTPSSTPTTTSTPSVTASPTATRTATQPPPPPTSTPPPVVAPPAQPSPVSSDDSDRSDNSGRGSNNSGSGSSSSGRGSDDDHDDDHDSDDDG
ncbi:MAG: hypothetical protein NZM00_01985 [Anaerolinea sp.]|nr:hypothetical protein [Anaerolinea sp.]